MSRKVYRTMQGRLVDIDKLRAQNEDTRAVGNMNVNARGDVLSASGEIVKTKEEVMAEYYETPPGAASSAPMSQTEASPAPAEPEQPVFKKITQEEVEAQTKPTRRSPKR